MISTPFDLLREKREALGLPEPSVAQKATRQTLLQGVAIGSGILGLALGISGLLFLRGVFVKAELDRLATVEAEEQQLQSRLNGSNAKLKQVQGSNRKLVEGLIGTRSSSALMRDLQLRVPEGVQLTDAQQQDQDMVLKGRANDPQAFVRINALQLDLKRSPLLDAGKGVTLLKASRDRSDATKDLAAPAVNFELRFSFRDGLPPASEKLILEQLGAEGLTRRMALLQKEGLLP
ncbi:PilN domain-containing protein [Cyanobium sp. NIES-981]|uniref:PilN domain-containing protein n=1 Tax=Cyanobium sp. NIES-981 TaxID=1851505 RepID=UPI0007DCE85C|nr:PilN domain-containing protein [Cyanobium sp. NIES-981]SBO43760.1 Tfp pilus assembly protein PilN [Cyanobium sp. NIES-981]